MASNDPVQEIYENVRSEALENTEPFSRALERVLRYGVASLLPACNRIFLSSFTLRVFLARPGTGSEIFTGRTSVRFMNSLPRR